MFFSLYKLTNVFYKSFRREFYLNVWQYSFSDLENFHCNLFKRYLKLLEYALIMGNFDFEDPDVKKALHNFSFSCGLFVSYCLYSNSNFYEYRGKLVCLDIKL